VYNLDLTGSYVHVSGQEMMSSAGPKVFKDVSVLTKEYAEKHHYRDDSIGIAKGVTPDFAIALQSLSNPTGQYSPDMVDYYFILGEVLDNLDLYYFIQKDEDIERMTTNKIPYIGICDGQPGFYEYYLQNTKFIGRNSPLLTQFEINFLSQFLRRGYFIDGKEVTFSCLQNRPLRSCTFREIIREFHRIVAQWAHDSELSDFQRTHYRNLAYNIHEAFGFSPSRSLHCSAQYQSRLIIRRQKYIVNAFGTRNFMPRINGIETEMAEYVVCMDQFWDNLEHFRNLPSTSYFMRVLRLYLSAYLHP